MRRMRRIPNGTIIEDFFKREEVEESIKNNRCKNNRHFPERIYYWEMSEQMKECGGYYAHCAICGTDYHLKREGNKVFDNSGGELWEEYK